MLVTHVHTYKHLENDAYNTLNIKKKQWHDQNNVLQFSAIYLKHKLHLHVLLR